MHQNQILLKGEHAGKVMGEAPDTRMVLMDGVVKSHRLILAASNSFLRQLICSSWLPGETSTFILPQHSVKDFLLDFSLPGNAFIANGEVLYDVEREIGEEEKNRAHSSKNETSYDFIEIKVEESDDEEDNIGDDQNGDHPPVNTDEFKQPVEPEEIFPAENFSPGFEQPGEIFCEINLAPGFEQTLKEVETPRKRLQPELALFDMPNSN